MFPSGQKQILIEYLKEILFVMPVPRDEATSYKACSRSSNSSRSSKQSICVVLGQDNKRGQTAHKATACVKASLVE